MSNKNSIEVKREYGEECIEEILIRVLKRLVDEEYMREEEVREGNNRIENSKSDTINLEEQKV